MDRRTISKLPGFVVLLLACFVLGVVPACSETNEADAEYVQSAREYLDKNDPSSASIELKNVLIRNPENAEARQLLGTVYVDMGDGATAEKELLRAYELGIPREGIIIPLGKSFLLQGKHTQLIAEIQPQNNLTTYNKAQVYALRGNAYIGESMLDEAAEAYRTALELEPDLILAQIGQARLAAVQGDMEEARSWIDKALANNPESPEAWSMLGNMELVAGNNSDAETALSNAIKLREYLGSNNIDIAKRALARIQLGKYTDADADIQTLNQGGFKEHPYVAYITGLAYFNQEKYSEAIEAFEASRNMNPSYLPVVYYLATSHYMSGNLEQAQQLSNSLQYSEPRSLAVQYLLGAILIRKSDFDAATDVLLKSLERSPDDEIVLAMLANASLLKGDSEQGIKYFEKILSLNPESTQAKQRLHLARLMNGQSLDFGITDDGLEQALTEDDQYNRGLLQALEAFQASKLDLAMERAQKLHEQYPEKVGPLKLISAYYLSSANWEKARQQLEKILAIKPGESSALFNLAMIEVKTNNFEQARSRLNDLLVVHPSNEKAILLLADIETQFGGRQAGIKVLQQAVTHNPDVLSLRTALAARYFRVGDIARVLALTSDLTDEQASEQPGLLELRGKAQNLQGSQTMALQTFQRWSVLAPDSVAAHYQYGNSLAISGDKDRARRELKKALQLDPAYLPARVGEIKMLAHGGDELELARKKLAILKKDYGKRVEVLGIDGWLAFGTKDYATAEDRFTAALEMKPDRELTLLLYKALWRQNKQEQAMTLLQDWLKDHPDDAAVTLEQANGFLLQNKQADANAAYMRVLELSPTNVLALNNLAGLNKDKDLKQAIKYAEKANQLWPDHPPVMDTYGMLLIKEGSVTQGYRILQKAASLAPQNPIILLHLGQAMIQQNKYNEAQEVLSAIIKAAPETPQAKAAKDLLKTLPIQ